MAITRLGLSGYGNRLTGDFSGKALDSGGGEHPVGRITRLGLNGFAARRAGLFSGKTESIAVAPIVTQDAGAEEELLAASIAWDDREIFELVQVVFQSGIIE